MAKFRCPVCLVTPEKSHKFEVANCGQIEDLGLSDGPDNGSVVVCPGCAVVLVIRDGRPRRPNPADWEDINSDYTLVQALSAAQTGVKNRIGPGT